MIRKSNIFQLVKVSNEKKRKILRATRIYEFPGFFLVETFIS